VSRSSNKLALLGSEHKATTTTNYTNLACNSLTYNMASTTLITKSHDVIVILCI